MGRQASEPYIVLKNITKKFPGVTALDNVDLEFYRGTIHALLGENGAGKSTLVKILAGIYVPDTGKIYIDGVETVFASPRDALEKGIVLVSQSPMLIDRLSVLENLVLGFRDTGLFKPVNQVYSVLTKLFHEYGLKIDPGIEVYKLTYTQKQLIEILRALMLGANTLLLDESITYLPFTEKKRIFDFLLKFREKGGLVVVITHKIAEALEIADKITVMRRGRIVETIDAGEKDADYIRNLMFGGKTGQELAGRGYVASVEEHDIVLKVDDLWVRGDLGNYMVCGASFSVKKGEIVGIAGITGNGQVELFEAIMGLRRIEKGSIELFGVKINGRDTGFIRRLGVGYIPDNPLRHGLSVENNIVENIALDPRYRGLWVKWELLEKNTVELINRYGIVTPNPYTPVKMLSGGNLMKTLIAREIESATRLLIAYNPTRSLDEYTAGLVKKIFIEKARREGVSILFTSEDLDDVLGISDRVLVMNSGRIVGEYVRGKIVRKEIEKLMVM